MHEELEQILKNKHVSLPVHRGEHPMPNFAPAPAPSFLSQVVNAHLPSSIAFSFVFFASAALISLTMQLPPEQDIEAAVTMSAVIPNGSPNSRVLGTSSAKALVADLKVDGRDNVIVPPGSEVMLSWTSRNATDCTVSPAGAEGLSGKEVIGKITKTQVFTLMCKNNGASVVDIAEVEVSNRPTLQRQ